ncbi:Cyclic pyranopterin monophosphate synthase [Rubripirellula amarantea]|uniref:Cyclic pyranopterin monophosphate synthase n=2 Tax=Rubripirellula amarantea TaxID=2527999 RepID=A0A5C5WJW3_9BACT|nr:Cyclic pyranopterin monophosphate synthase [Rubripirellula amarantea]
MPEHDAVFAPREQLLTFEELHRLTSLLVTQMGVNRVRITGGEPLVRRELPTLIQMLAGIPGLEDLSLTTNGVLLAEHADALRDAGLQRLNISLDTLDESTFQRISRRSGLAKVIEGIDAAIAAGFQSVKLNALAIAGVSEPEITRLAEFAIDRGVSIRFIEFMPLDSDRDWTSAKVLTGDRLLAILRERFGEVTPIQRADQSQPSEDFLVGRGRVGIIRSVSEPFCGSCDRLRITADGSMRNCLFASEETPLRELMRSGAHDQVLADQIASCVAAKKAAHGIDDASFSPPIRPMYSIGG